MICENNKKLRMEDIKMKKVMQRMFVSLLTLVMLGNTMTAFAADSVSGKSSGGSAGIANCSGSITLKQGGLWDNDSVTAYTNADATGTYGVAAVVWYNDGTGEKSKYEDIIVHDSTSQISVTSEAPNDYANRGTGGHSYSSTIRGSWSAGTSKDF